MYAITIPQLHCPFPPAINPFVAAAAIHTDEWVTKFGLHTGHAFEKYQHDNFAWLTARFYTTASRARLEIANDLFVLLFAIDDQLDNQLEKAVLVQKEETLQTFIEDIAAIMNGHKAVSARKGPPALAALTELWGRIERISPPGWTQRFAQSMLELFKAAIWEFENAHAIQLPTVAQFLERRQYLGVAHIGTGIISITEGIYLPDEALYHPTVLSLVELCRNIICWSNDLFSLSKELEHGDEHNLVCVLKNEQHLTLEAAILQTAEIHNATVRKFMALSGQLPVFDDVTNRSLARYVQVLCRQMRGNIDWSEQDTKRYSFVYGAVC